VYCSTINSVLSIHMLCNLNISGSQSCLCPKRVDSSGCQQCLCNSILLYFNYWKRIATRKAIIKFILTADTDVCKQTGNQTMCFYFFDRQNKFSLARLIIKPFKTYVFFNFELKSQICKALSTYIVSNKKQPWLKIQRICLLVT